MVDAGHGGKDPGAPGRFGAPSEKVLVLDMAQKLANALRGRGAKVVMTRTRDVFIELEDRAAAADRYRADLLISIHVNAAKRASAAGTTFYIARGALSKSLRTALRLNSAFKRGGIGTNGVERANFKVLAGHSRPAVLIETGFMTNAADARRLNTDSYRTKLTAAIVAGVADAVGR